jgi:hypothetical protein
MEAAFAKLCGGLERENESASPQPWRQPAGQCCPVSRRDRPNAKPPADSRLRQKRKADGKGKMNIIRCLKRFVAHEMRSSAIYAALNDR